MLQRPRFHAALLWFLLALTGCSLDVKFEDSHYACENGGSCPLGYECRNDFCEPIEEQNDAAPLDAAASGLDASQNVLADAALVPPDAPPPDAALPPDAIPSPCTIFDPGTGHCYFRVAASLTWTGARSGCQALGGYLAIITSSSENALIHTLDDGTIDETWIGASDFAAELDWRWVDGRDFPPSPGGNALSFHNWNSGEPNNFNGNEDCAIFELTGNGGWDDKNCSVTRSSICEVE